MRIFDVYYGLKKGEDIYEVILELFFLMLFFNVLNLDRVYFFLSSIFVEEFFDR